MQRARTHVFYINERIFSFNRNNFSYYLDTALLNFIFRRPAKFRRPILYLLYYMNI